VLYTGYKDAHDYDVNTVASNMYKISVGVWLLLGLSSCASVITTMKDTYSAIVWRIEDKAVKLKEKAEDIHSDHAGTWHSRRASTRSKQRVQPADSERQSQEPDSDAADDRIWIT